MIETLYVQWYLLIENEKRTVTTPSSGLISVTWAGPRPRQAGLYAPVLSCRTLSVILSRDGSQLLATMGQTSGGRPTIEGRERRWSGRTQSCACPCPCPCPPHTPSPPVHRAQSAPAPARTRSPTDAAAAARRLPPPPLPVRYPSFLSLYLLSSPTSILCFLVDLARLLCVDSVLPQAKEQLYLHRAIGGRSPSRVWLLI
jgi:hypothetical protein